MLKTTRRPFTKKIDRKFICKADQWTIISGSLVRKRGRPEAAKSLFKAVAEKIPYEFLDKIEEYTSKKHISPSGVYIAHDSMGYPRYIGRGQNVFERLRARHNAQVLELERAAGPLLHFNERKKRIDIQAGDVKDFEAGTAFFQRQYTRGRRPRATKRREVTFFKKAA